MECANCKNQLKEGAKFCGKCGTKVEQSNNNKKNSCVECGNELKAAAKFCGKCGTPQPAKQNNNSSDDNPNKGYIMWEMKPGQIALRLTESIFSQYNKSAGVVIPEGYLAMILCGGKLQSMLDAGVYKFENENNTDILSSISDFFRNIFSSRKNRDNTQNKKDIEAISQAVKNRIPVEIIVCRSSAFNLPFVIKDVPTSAIKVDLGIMLSMQVSNLLELYKKYLLDKTVLAADTFATELTPYLENEIKLAVSTLAPDNIDLNSDLKNSLKGKLESIFNDNFKFVQFIDVVKINTDRAELDRLNNLSEEMYLSERELEHLSRRNEFMNRLTQEQNSAELQNAENSADFNRRLADINRDNLLNEEQMANLQREITERSEDHEMNRARAIELMVVQHQHDLQSARLKMEEELGTRMFNLQLERQKQSDDYADERRRKEIDLDKEEQLSQLEILQQAQNIREQREQASHTRKLEEERQSQSHEMDKLNVYSGMSAEQIMVANPDIKEEAARAMAEKFKAEAAEAANDSRAANAMEQTRMMKEFMEQQMQAVRDMSNANAQAMGGMLEAKEREIQRTQQMVDKNEDRYASVVNQQIASDRVLNKKKCNACGQPTGEEVFCPECGNRVS